MSTKIAITVSNDLHQDQRMHRIAETLSTDGFDVTLVGRKLLTSGRLGHQIYTQHRIKCFFSTGPLFYLEYNIRLLIWMWSSDFSIVYSVDLDTLLAGTMMKMLTKCKLIFDAHEYFTEVPELDGYHLKKKIWSSVGKWCVPTCDLCITVNQELSDILSQKYNMLFEVIRSVPMMHAVVTIPNPKRVILYQGVLNEGRGLEVAIEAICKSSIDIELHIAGEGDLSDPLRKLKSEIDIHNKVTFLGWKTRGELHEITKNAWLGLNLLDAKSLNYKYSLANKFFDYMHAHVPSINMNFPVYKRYIDESEVGICIDLLNVYHVLDAINLCATNQEKYDAMVNNCQLMKQKYNWQIESEHLCNLVSNI